MIMLSFANPKWYAFDFAPQDDFAYDYFLGWRDWTLTIPVPRVAPGAINSKPLRGSGIFHIKEFFGTQFMIMLSFANPKWYAFDFAPQDDFPIDYYFSWRAKHLPIPILRVAPGAINSKPLQALV